MPISYSIDPDCQIIREVWTGTVKAEDLKKYWIHYLADPQVMSIRRTLVDIREAQILFKGSELFILVKEIVLPALQGRDWKTAIIVRKPVQYGVSRQYQVVAELYSKDSIFEEEESAMEWLKKQ